MSTSYEAPSTLLIISPSVRRIKMFQIKIVEKITTRILPSIILFSKVVPSTR